MPFELINDQRIYLGLDPIESHWDKLCFTQSGNQPEGWLYFDGDIIKRYIVSNQHLYLERQYNEPTRGRSILLPKTGKGKEKKLTPPVLAARQPTGVYCQIESHGHVFIGSYTTQTTFYDSRWEKSDVEGAPPRAISDVVNDFIVSVPSDYLKEIQEFKAAKRKLTKFKPGDYFAFKVSRTEYGFGRVLLDIAQLRKKGLIEDHHGLLLLMTKPVLVKIYVYLSKTKEVNLADLQNANSMPSDYMMDNLLLYGQFEVIAHQSLKTEDFDFPMSYGRHIDSKRQASFLQWGLIHRELPIATFNKYFAADNPFASEGSYSRKVSNPYGYYGVGFYPKFCNKIDIQCALNNNGRYNFEKSAGFFEHFDLRNPINKEIRQELMLAFGLDHNKTYEENCALSDTIHI